MKVWVGGEEKSPVLNCSESKWRQCYLDRVRGFSSNPNCQGVPIRAKRYDRSSKKAKRFKVLKKVQYLKYCSQVQKGTKSNLVFREFRRTPLREDQRLTCFPGKMHPSLGGWDLEVSSPLPGKHNFKQNTNFQQSLYR